MIAVTGASGKLGQIVIQELIKEIPPNQIIAIVRNPSKAENLKAMGVLVREADYSNAEAWPEALAGVDKLLLISAPEFGKRTQQHSTVINAAKKAGVKLLAYTSILRADTSSMEIAKEHKQTEEQIKKSGVPFVMLRNGWYIENYTQNLATALQHGALMGSSSDGRIAAASRTDYAAAAAAVLVNEGHANKTYELVADEAFTMQELTGEVQKLSGKDVIYKDIPVKEYENLLTQFGLPAPAARILADADKGASEGELDGTSKDLSRLIARPTESLHEAVKRALPTA